MEFNLMQLGLLLAGWVTAFLLGRELQVGYVQWRKRAAESPRGRNR